MKLINNILIWIVGGLFIFSGMIKVNDPIGTAIKMKEYFEVFAEDFGSFFHYFVPVALPIAIIMVVLEVVLGISLLANYKRRFTINALLALIVFFTFLTFYSAYFNKVTDCGCFGDAIKLTPWQSFGKDIVLLIMIGILAIQQKSFKNTATFPATIATGLGLAMSFGICYYALEHLPPVDFRPYKIGDNISANMEPQGQPNIVYTFTKDGEEVESKDWMKKEDGYEYLSSVVTNEAEIQPKITDYNVMDPDNGDYTDATLEGEKLFIIVDMMDNAHQPSMEAIGDLAKDLTQANVEAIILTADYSGTEALAQRLGWQMPIYSSDATVLKAMIRSNPGVMVLKDGTVKGKWHYNDTPTATEALQALGK